MSWISRLLRGPEAPMIGASGPGADASATSGAPARPSAGPAAAGPGAAPRSFFGRAPAPRRPPLTGAALRARSAALTRTKFREGYDTDQVDAYLATMVQALEGTGPVPPWQDVLNHRFSATKFREGYDQDAVDDLLDEVVTTLQG